MLQNILARSNGLFCKCFILHVTTVFHRGYLQNKTFADHLQKCFMLHVTISKKCLANVFQMFKCFILHVSTSRNVLQMFYAKASAKMLQNIFIVSHRTFFIRPLLEYVVLHFSPHAVSCPAFSSPVYST